MDNANTIVSMIESFLGKSYKWIAEHHVPSSYEKILLGANRYQKLLQLSQLLPTCYPNGWLHLSLVRRTLGRYSFFLTFSVQIALELLRYNQSQDLPLRPGCITGNINRDQQTTMNTRIPITIQNLLKPYRIAL
jgi:hypothetical protein